jgi:hypothetical protein
MATYSIPGSQAATASTYRGVTATWCSSTARRHRWYQFELAATSLATDPDTYFQVDLSRLSQTTSLAGTAFVPTPYGADGPASMLAAVNMTTEPATALIAANLFNRGMGQRDTVRWGTSDESQMLIVPATAGAGLYLRVRSANYLASVDGETNVME